MATINPYLNFPGTAEEAFTFYKSVFGGEFTALQRMGETPESDKIPPEEKDKIMHIALPIGGNILMASDALESHGHKVILGNSAYVSVTAENPAEGERLFKALSEGGSVEMPFQKMFWGGYFASFTDKFGIRWMVACDDPASKS